MTHQVNVVLEKDKEGYYAHCPQLPGCQSQGATFEEAMQHIREAAELYLGTMSAEEIRAVFSKEIITATLEVSLN